MWTCNMIKDNRNSRLIFFQDAKVKTRPAATLSKNMWLMSPESNVPTKSQYDQIRYPDVCSCSSAAATDSVISWFSIFTFVCHFSLARIKSFSFCSFCSRCWIAGSVFLLLEFSSPSPLPPSPPSPWFSPLSPWAAWATWAVARPPPPPAEPPPRPLLPAPAIAFLVLVFFLTCSVREGAPPRFSQCDQKTFFLILEKPKIYAFDSLPFRILILFFDFDTFFVFEYYISIHN